MSLTLDLAARTFKRCFLAAVRWCQSEQLAMATWTSEAARMKIAVTILGLSLGLMTACGDDAPAKPTCDEIAEACHDSTPSVGMECHELTEAEDTTEAELTISAE